MSLAISQNNQLTENWWHVIADQKKNKKSLHKWLRWSKMHKKISSSLPSYQDMYTAKRIYMSNTSVTK